MASRGTRSKRDDAGAGRRKVREFDQDFEIKLEPAERAGEAMAVADLIREYDSLELAIKEHNKPKRDRMKEIRKLLTRHSTNALTGKRIEKVAVEEFFDAASELVIVVRTDTEQVLGNRKPSQAELDEWIEFGANPEH